MKTSSTTFSLVDTVNLTGKMKVTTPEISWHERDPVYSADFQPGTRSIQRIVTAGVDKYARV